MLGPAYVEKTQAEGAVVLVRQSHHVTAWTSKSTVEGHQIAHDHLAHDNDATSIMDNDKSGTRGVVNCGTIET